MSKKQTLEEILSILYTIKEDKVKLKQVHQFLIDNIYKEPNEEIMQIPEKYKLLCNNVAQDIDTGEVCFINIKTYEYEGVPKELLLNPDEYFDITGEEFKYKNWDNYIKIEPLESDASFEIMENFANNLSDVKLTNMLSYALNNRKPFANFKNVIDNSQYREQWFDYKQKQLEKYVYGEIIRAI